MMSWQWLTVGLRCNLNDPFQVNLTVISIYWVIKWPNYRPQPFPRVVMAAEIELRIFSLSRKFHWKFDNVTETFPAAVHHLGDSLLGKKFFTKLPGNCRYRFNGITIFSENSDVGKTLKIVIIITLLRGEKGWWRRSFQVGKKKTFRGRKLVDKDVKICAWLERIVPFLINSIINNFPPALLMAQVNFWLIM